MPELNPTHTHHSNQPQQEETAKPLKVSDREAFSQAIKMFEELEAMGASDFQIFNGLADLFHTRGQSDVSELMAEAAYKCFQKN